MKLGVSSNSRTSLPSFLTTNKVSPEGIDSFDKSYSIENYAYTLLSIIPNSIKDLLQLNNDYKLVLSGGGRKNLTLVSLFKNIFSDVSIIDDYNLDGDFIEAQGMAVLAIRYLKKLPSSFEKTTGIKKKIYLGEKC